MNETQLREELAMHAKSLFDRGLSSGSTGNISVRLEDGWLMTPTGSSMGTLDPAKISRLDAQGNHIGGDKPTKETALHMAMYNQRPKAGAVVHLHSSYAVAVSCMGGLNVADVMPPLTAYYVMRVGTLPMVPYYPPGDPALGAAVEKVAGDHHAVLMANHGPIVAGKSLADAVYASEELEETAKIFVALGGMKTAPLSAEEMAELKRRFPVTA